MDKIEKIEEDVKEMKDPFNEEDLPEYVAVNSVQERDRDMFLTLGVSINYNRNASNLWSNCLELYSRNRNYVRDSDKFSYNELLDDFEDIAFRYKGKDCDIWYTNLEIIEEEYGDVQTMVESANYNAPELVEQIREDGFKYLKGDKLAPWYAKVVDYNLYDLDDMWDLDIPVDTHIRRLSKDLMGYEATDDEIREWWSNRDCSVHVVDTGLWLIGSNWDDWGENYWNSL